MDDQEAAGLPDRARDALVRAAELVGVSPLDARASRAAKRAPVERADLDRAIAELSELSDLSKRAAGS